MAGRDDRQVARHQSSPLLIVIEAWFGIRNLLKRTQIIQNRATMTIETLMQKRWCRFLLGFCFWTLLGLSFASQFYISSAKAGLEVSWKQAVNYALADWYVFALLSIPVIHLARRFRLTKCSSHCW